MEDIKKTLSGWAKSFGISERLFYYKLKNGEIVNNGNGYKKSESYIEPKKVGNRVKQYQKVEYVRMPDHPILIDAPVDGVSAWNNNQKFYIINWKNSKQVGFTFEDRLMMGVMDTMFRMQSSEDRLLNDNEKLSYQISFESIARLLTGKAGRVKTDVIKNMVTNFVAKVYDWSEKVQIITGEQKDKNGSTEILKEKELRFGKNDYVINGNFVTVRKSVFAKTNISLLDVDTKYFGFGKNYEKNILAKANFAYRVARANSICKANGKSNKEIAIKKMSKVIGYDVNSVWMRNYLRYMTKHGVIIGYAMANDVVRLTSSMTAETIKEDAIAEAEAEEKKEVRTRDKEAEAIKNNLEYTENNVAMIVAKLKEAEEVVEVETETETETETEIIEQEQVQAEGEHTMRAKIRFDSFSSFSSFLADDATKSMMRLKSDFDKILFDIQKEKKEKNEEKADTPISSMLEQWRAKMSV